MEVDGGLKTLSNTDLVELSNMGMSDMWCRVDPHDLT